MGPFRDWIQATLRLREGRIEDILLLGKGTFMVLFTSQECVAPLLSQSPLSVEDRLIFLVEWYEDFDKDMCRVPRFPVKLSFPGLLL